MADPPLGANPVSLRMTSAISSSVCRLPLMSAATFPACTGSTAFSAAAWLCGWSTTKGGDVEAKRCGKLPDPRLGPDQDRLDDLRRRGLDHASRRHLVAGVRDRRAHRRQSVAAVFSASYFSCLRGSVMAVVEGNEMNTLLWECVAPSCSRGRGGPTLGMKSAMTKIEVRRRVGHAHPRCGESTSL
jgi:hypothetical protein